MSIVSPTKMTARQFLQLGEDPAGIRLELVNGEVAVSPSPTPKHSYAEKVLSVVLFQYIKAKRLGQLFGDVDTIFGQYDVRRPDLIFFRTDRLHLIGEKAMEGPPDLCVEILSPSSRLIDRRDKFLQYAKGKVPFYWIVDPDERTIEGFKLTRGAYRPTSSGKNDDVIAPPPFPDLSIDLSELWWPRK
jgi:Uma2 family endonuclease